MKTLGRIIRFLFALQAVTLVVTIPGLLWLLYRFQNGHVHAEAQDRAARFMIALATTSALKFVPAIVVEAPEGEPRSPLVGHRGKLALSADPDSRGRGRGIRAVAFVSALYARDLPAAEVWWLKLQAVDSVEYNADYWRARASIMWLRGELEDARHAWERGNEMAQKFPAFGAYDFTRWQFTELRKVLDQEGVAVTPDPETANPVGV